MDKVSAKNAVKALALGDRIVFKLHAKKRDPSHGKFPLTREQVRNCLIHGVVTEGPAPDLKELNGWKMRKHEVVCVLILDKNVLVVTGYGYARRAR